MKHVFLFQFFFTITVLISQNNGPKEISPQILLKLNTEIDKEVPALKLMLLKKEFTAEQIEFSIDTFRIEQLVSKRMDIDYTTFGMNTTVMEKTNSYDKLMNRYYYKLLKSLNVNDKKVLIKAQKSWLVFRDTEAKLINTLTKEQYSGGGTIQSNIATASYSDIVIQRTIAVFNYYDALIKK
ncbi:lysozyme inhibitor LprI family protein [Flavobacterium ovatum]|uniref:lysozyme inhibitor LprI family protein n=1 Tax=Flavobacterium ovatum TaxID=1928857 RepID=UPI00344C563C